MSEEATETELNAQRCPACDQLITLPLTRCPSCGVRLSKGVGKISTSRRALFERPAVKAPMPAAAKPDALGTCPDCKHIVAKRAWVCPGCGAPAKRVRVLAVALGVHALVTVVILLRLGLPAMGHPGTMAVCEDLRAAGVAAECKPDTPAGPVAGAVEATRFSLASAPGRAGQVLRFESSAVYDRAMKAVQDAALLVGTHRYASSRALVFVQIGADVSDDVDAKVRVVVSRL
jgi:hypothetical protein